jgi:hypothetical protein
MNFPLRIYGFFLVEFLKDVDREVNDHLPDGTFSQFSSEPRETISSAIGKGQAFVLWVAAQRQETIDYPYIPLRYPLGQIAEDVCEIFQPFHGLRSIEWDRGVNMEALYEGIKQVVHDYLKTKGISIT